MGREWAVSMLRAAERECKPEQLTAYVMLLVTELVLTRIDRLESLLVRIRDKDPRGTPEQRGSYF